MTLDLSSQLHLFVTCGFVDNFWTSFNRWMSEILHIRINLLPVDIIFGKIGKRYKLLNLFLVLAKLHIYKQKYRNNIPCLDTLKFEIQYYCKMEKQIFQKNNSLLKFEEKWRLYLNYNQEL